MPEHAEIAVVGVGAAGMFAAIHAASPGARVVALDGAKKLGAKILVAGGGRCNVTHDVVRPVDYAGGSSNAVAKVLRTFSVDQTVDWFAQRGVKLKREDTGKLFPVTDRAQTVLDALLGAMRQAGVEVMHPRRVTGVTRTDPSGFTLETESGPVNCDRLILATGGKALPRTGSDGLGYRFAEALGHTVTATTPALVPLILQGDHWARGLSGLSLPVTLSLRSGSNKIVHSQAGSMLFTHFGLSGPAPMDLSRHWLTSRASDPGANVTANLTPDALDFDQADAALRKEAELQPKRPVGLSLSQAFALPQRLAEALAHNEAGADPARPASRLRKEDRRALAHALTALPLPVVGDRGYTHAEVTAGGVPLTEVDLKTMASRRCPGLHLCGELLDVDGRIGGYNFQWAWCTGRLAGISAGSIR